MAAIVGCAGLEAGHGRGRGGPDRRARQQGGAGHRRRADDRRGDSAAARPCCPVDSEHNAIFQCLAGNRVRRCLKIDPDRQRRAVPHRVGRDRSRAATPAQAVAHPNWSMGAKISVNSATLMNKGLELIEAHYLFGLPSDRIDILIHPQSVVHSLVEFVDGSVLAQLGSPDMRIPIAYALAWPERMATPAQRLDLAAIAQARLRSAGPGPLSGAAAGARSARGGRRGADRPQRRQRSRGRRLPRRRDRVSPTSPASSSEALDASGLRRAALDRRRARDRPRDARQRVAIDAEGAVTDARPTAPLADPDRVRLRARPARLLPRAWPLSRGAAVRGPAPRPSRSALGARSSAGPTSRARAGRSAGCRSAAMSSSSAT